MINISNKKRTPKFTFELGLEYSSLNMDLDAHSPYGRIRLSQILLNKEELKRLNTITLTLLCEIPIAGMNIEQLIVHTNEIRTDISIIKVLKEVLDLKIIIKDLNLPQKALADMDKISVNWMDIAQVCNNKLRYHAAESYSTQKIFAQDELRFLDYIQHLIMDKSLCPYIQINPSFVFWKYYINENVPAEMKTIDEFIAHRKNQIENISQLK